MHREIVLMVLSSAVRRADSPLFPPVRKVTAARARPSFTGFVSLARHQCSPRWGGTRPRINTLARGLRSREPAREPPRLPDGFVQEGRQCPCSGPVLAG